MSNPLPPRGLRTRLSSILVPAFTIAVMWIGADPAHASRTEATIRHITTPDGTGSVRYSATSSTHRLDVTLTATGRSGCFEVWVDFTTSPREHHDPYRVHSCRTPHATKATIAVESSRITGFRMAACHAATSNAPPERCRISNTTSNFAAWVFRHGRYTSINAI